METQTSYEVADEFRCGHRKIETVAAAKGIGVNLKGRAGWRFTEADKLALWEAMKAKPATPVRRRVKSA